MSYKYEFTETEIKKLCDLLECVEGLFILPKGAKYKEEIEKIKKVARTPIISDLTRTFKEDLGRSEAKIYKNKGFFEIVVDGVTRSYAKSYDDALEYIKKNKFIHKK